MSSPIPLELQSKIAAWRIAATEGTLSLEEMKEGIKLLRAGRLQAAVAASEGTRKRKAAIAVIPSADDMLAELGGI